MSGANGDSKIARFVVFGTFAVTSISLFVYYFYINKKSKKVDNCKGFKDAKETEKSADDIDNDESYEDNEDTDESAAKSASEEAALRQQYESATKISTAYINAQDYSKAVESLSEAISLTGKVPSASKDLLSLYNNRSAMYEKQREFDNALRDITAVLTMRPDHLKARIRRARVYESQGKLVKSLQEYVFATLLERLKGEIASNEHKIGTIGRLLALERSVKVLEDIRHPKEYVLPSKAYCRNFFEGFPNHYTWKANYDGRSRFDLSKKFEEAQKSLSEGTDFAMSATLELGLDLVRYDIVQESYAKAFETLESLQNCKTSVSGLHSRNTLSLYHELVGAHAHLCRDVFTAQKEYVYAIELMPKNLSAHLKLANALLDLGETVEVSHHNSRVPLLENITNKSVIISIQAEQKYTELLAMWVDHGKDQKSEDVATTEAATTAATGTTSTTHHDRSEDDETAFSDARSSPPPLEDDIDSPEDRAVCRAWVLYHRSVLWVTRDMKGGYMPDALEKALSDLDQVVLLTGKLCLAILVVHPYAATFPGVIEA